MSKTRKTKEKLEKRILYNRWMEGNKNETNKKMYINNSYSNDFIWIMSNF